MLVGSLFVSRFSSQLKISQMQITQSFETNKSLSVLKNEIYIIYNYNYSIISFHLFFQGKLKHKMPVGAINSIGIGDV